MRKILIIIAILGIWAIGGKAQRQQVIVPDIRTLQVVAGDRWRDLPVITLGGDEKINISFDDMTHEYRRYTYTLRHCEADWSESRQIFESDYCEGFASGNTIDDSEQSLNTNNQYTHYSLSLPNDKCRMKLSGNYEVTIYDENNDETPVAKAFFMVAEPIMGVSMSMTSNTDRDINGRHQQIGVQLNYGGLRVTDPENQVRTVLMQNGRWDNCRINAKPQYVMTDGLRWHHCRDFIFEGGNEYRKFEALDVSHTTLGLDRMEWDGHQYHAYVWTDEPRPSYVYDEVAQGAFYIRNSDNRNNDTETDYLYVHFSLKSPRISSPIFLNGNWTYDSFAPEYEMKWNDERQQYEGTVMLKQGYYSYQYLVLRDDGTTAPVPTEGNFYQTNNEYQALVYYKGIGERTYRLVGYGSITNR